MHTQVHLILFVQLILLTPWLLISALKHTLLMSIECDYCPMQPRIITFVISQLKWDVLPTCSPLDCYTRTHWRWKTATDWSHADFKEGTLWHHIPALISLPKILCNTYTQIKITKQKNSKLVITKFALSVTGRIAVWAELWILKMWFNFQILIHTGFGVHPGTNQCVLKAFSL